MIYFLMVMQPFFFSCNKDALNENSFISKLQSGKEIIPITEEDYPEDLKYQVQGNVIIESQKNYFGNSEYVFSASIEGKNKAEISLSGQTFFALKDIEGLNIQAYHSANDNPGGNMSFMSSLFGKNTSVNVRIAGGGETSESFYSPAELAFLNLVQNDDEEFELNSDDMLTWASDGSNTNGIIVGIRHVTLPNSNGDWPEGNSYLLLTPDDGSLSINNLLPYLPEPGNFVEIKLSRIGFKVWTYNSMKFRVISTTSTYHSFKYNP